jgi:F-type H+-transporting ATPase subunit gamma
METPESLKRSIGTAEELHSVVRTMKTLSSTSIRQYDRAVSAMGHYVRTVELGFRVLLREMAIPSDVPAADERGPIGLIIFGTDRGFCGPFNRDIAAFAVDRLRSRESDAGRRLACLGTHLAPELELRGEDPAWVSRMPSSVEGIVGSVQALLLELDEWQAQGVERILMFHQRPAEEHTHEPHVTQVIPLDHEWLRSLARRAWPTREIPASYQEPRSLLTALTREYVFASLYRAHAESLASEHAARLDAMRSAEQTIEDRLDELEQRYHQVRQAAITEELLDVTSGFEAMSQAER